MIFKNKYFVYLFFFELVFACSSNSDPAVTKHKNNTNEIELFDSQYVLKNTIHFDSITIPQIEIAVIKAGLVDIKTMDSTIVVDLKYSGTNNFIGIDVYEDYNKCYLQPAVALKLKRAQQLLKVKYPYYNLIVFDAVRPLKVQCKLWELINVPNMYKSTFVSNPKTGSLHNYGAAVDVSIVDENGVELDMGTAFDFFGELAYPREEYRMIYEGKLAHKQLLNRDILRNVMREAGFSSITTEWWHFNSCSLKEASSNYNLIE